MSRHTPTCIFLLFFAKEKLTFVIFCFEAQNPFLFHLFGSFSFKLFICINVHLV